MSVCPARRNCGVGLASRLVVPTRQRLKGSSDLGHRVVENQIGLIEELRDVAQQQLDLADATRDAAALSAAGSDDAAALSGPLAPRQEALAARAGDIADALAEQSNQTGGVVDDLIVYRLDTERVMLVVNAGTRSGDLSWLQTHMPTTGVTLEDISESTAKIDVQGPHSSTTLAAVLPQGLPNLKYYQFTTCHFHDQELTISRTGYTGELGYEFYGPADAVVALWEACISAGAEPAGLGARDTLRLEAGYPLYGHELEAKRPAYESGFTKSIDLSKAFLGRDALHSAPPAHRLIGIQLAGRRSARAGDRLVRPGTDEQIGVVTSGSFGPSVGFAVALGYCKTDFNPPEGTLDVVGTRTRLPAKIAPLPFYTEGSVRKKLDPQ